ncbi:MAG: hypothetical protein FKY71_08150 [Spiribacter salinus]|uniref:Uncharacterized protein n=1 Tax=Spiribacter salinus TaxID=1335746 RepID=A0A540VRY0_9GAMM|nr:MAG: hypothetical protein FKY71_08150 [Spiribacter salinus]
MQQRASDMVLRWVRMASDAVLQEKLQEYASERRDLSPRDVETRAALAAAIRVELAQRAPTVAHG